MDRAPPRSDPKQEKQTVRPLQMLQHMRQRILLLQMRRFGQQMNDDFRIGVD